MPSDILAGCGAIGVAGRGVADRLCPKRPEGRRPVGGDDGKTAGDAVLWAFGQRWGEPVTVKDGAVEFVAPKVRVPVVFQVVSVNRRRLVRDERSGGHSSGELVVYPDRPIAWDKDTQLVAVGTPDWFDTWSEAVGLPVKKLKDVKSLDAGNWRMLEKPGLLILGRKAAGRRPGRGPPACRRAHDQRAGAGDRLVRQQ